MARKSRRKTGGTPEGASAETEQRKTYATAIYVRLSVENLGRDDNGASIENQKDVCREYISQRPDLKLAGVYEDNGWSGTVMHRPAFDRMMEDVRRGAIQAIVVRDLSRFARNYIEAGTYLEQIFPELGVRFISVKERLDTIAEDVATSFSVPLQNIINDLYAKDISRKVETAFAAQMRAGAFRWRSVPYGYKKNEGHTNIVPDALRADIVRQIFRWRAQDVPIKEIVRRLNAMGAPKSDTAYSQGKPWCSKAVYILLRNPAYIGTRVIGKRHSALYKGIRQEKTAPETWNVFPNAHEPLVSREVFDDVQRRMDGNARKRQESMEKSAAHRADLADLFEGKIFCADCGHRMYYTRMTYAGKADGWHGRYRCSSYTLKRAGIPCKSHSISQRKLESVVFTVLRTHIQIALDYEKLVAGFQDSETAKQERRRLEAAVRKAAHKLEDAKRRRLRLYEDYANDMLDREEYLAAKEAYGKEAEEWSARVSEATAERDAYQEAMSTQNLWIRTMSAVQGIKGLDKGLVDATIERVEVYDNSTVGVVMKYRDIFEQTKCCLEGGGDDA